MKCFKQKIAGLGESPFVLGFNHLRVGRNTVSFRQTLDKRQLPFVQLWAQSISFCKAISSGRARCLMMIGPFLTWAPHPIIQVMIVGLGLVSYVADVGFDTEGMIDWLTMTGCHR